MISQEQEEKKYVDICALRHKAQIQDLVEELKKIEKSSNDSSKELMLFVRAEFDIREQLEILSESTEKHSEKYRKEFRELQKMANYENIKITEVSGKSALVGHTEEVLIDFEGKRYKLGKFKITLQNAQATIENLTRKQSSYDHPHVSKTIPCLGDLKASLPKLMGKHEYALVFDILFKFLTSYNPNSPYQAITKWPSDKIKEKKNDKL